MQYIGMLQGVSVMTNAPDLYEHALVGTWPKLLARLATHPQEAKWSDKCKNTALHLVCRRQPPLEVVLALIRSNPVSPTLLTVDGLTPLHFACYCGASPEVISVLIQTNKEATSLSEKRGKTPLHCTCAGFRNADREKVIKMLLECYSNAAILPDEKGRTPLALIFDNYAEEIEEEVQKESDSAYISLNSINTNENQQTSDSSQKKTIPRELQECFKLVSALLRAAYHGSIGDPPPKSDKFRILHASVGISDSPPQFIKLLMRMNPGDEKEVDTQGKLPLHVAALTKLFDETTRTSTTMVDFGASDDGSARIKQKMVDSATIIQELLSSYPDAASVCDKDGKTPFLLALEAGKPWDGGLSNIIQAHPQAFDEEKVERAILEALSSNSQYLRDETVKTVSNLFQFMKKSSVVQFMQKLKKGAAGNGVKMNNEIDQIGVQTSMLKALLGLLQKGKHDIKILGIHITQDSEIDSNLKELVEAHVQNTASIDELYQLLTQSGIYVDEGGIGYGSVSKYPSTNASNNINRS